MRSPGNTDAAVGRNPPAWQLIAVVLLTTLITASSLDEIAPSVARLLRVLAYASTLLAIAWLAWPLLRMPAEAARTFLQAYHRTVLWPLVLYFAGLLIGSLRGPQPLYSLWQTASDAIVFAFAFLAFGWRVDGLNRIVRQYLKVIALWTGILLLGSATIYAGNLAGWWLINPYYHPGDFGYRMLMNGPFKHANHLAYVLMTGAFAASYLGLAERPRIHWGWSCLAGGLALGVAVTYGRGAMLGTAIGLLGILYLRRRALALTLGVLASLLAMVLAAGAAGMISLPEFLPKVSIAGRDALWDAAIANVRVYGPLGVGPGSADSLPGMGIHNFLLEQYGEGGVLALLGVLGWLALPVIQVRRARLSQPLAWSIVAAMAGLMVHGLFWSQFLNGLRFLTLVFVCLWTALATPLRDTNGEASGSMGPHRAFPSTSCRQQPPAASNAIKGSTGTRNRDRPTCPTGNTSTAIISRITTRSSRPVCPEERRLIAPRSAAT